MFMLSIQFMVMVKLFIDMSYMPSSKYIEMPAFGMMFNLYREYDHVKYLGFGPEENYIDRNKGALLGEYEYDVLENVTSLFISSRMWK